MKINESGIITDINKISCSDCRYFVLNGRFTFRIIDFGRDMHDILVAVLDYQWGSAQEFIPLLRHHHRDQCVGNGKGPEHNQFAINVQKGLFFGSEGYIGVTSSSTHVVISNIDPQIIPASFSRELY